MIDGLMKELGLAGGSLQDMAPPELAGIVEKAVEDMETLDTPAPEAKAPDKKPAAKPAQSKAVAKTQPKKN